MKKFINDGDFVTINTNKFEKEFGVKKGSLAYIAGHRAFPISEQNPYTQRIKFFVSLTTEDGHVQVKPIYLMDPKSLKLVDEDTRELLQAIFEDDFQSDEPYVQNVEEPAQLSLPLDAAIN